MDDLIVNLLVPQQKRARGKSRAQHTFNSRDRRPTSTARISTSDLTDESALQLFERDGKVRAAQAPKERTPPTGFSRIPTFTHTHSPND